MSWQTEKDQLNVRPSGRWTGAYPAPLPTPAPDRPRRWNTGCGTDPGWWHHRHNGQDPCQPCVDAHDKALKAWAEARLARAAADLLEVD